jgi:GNAT superfamily N-acetyltransferase
MTEREVALIAAYKASIHILNGMLVQQFFEKMQEWEVFPVKVDDQIVGAILRKENDMHVSIIPEGRHKWFGKEAQQLIDDTIEQYGSAKTSVADSNEAGHRFVKKLGFKPINHENDVTFYMKDRNET